MELRQLEYLVAVADEASFTRAAERLHVAQPGVSAQVRRLEAELGQELLDRSCRGVRVTHAGAPPPPPPPPPDGRAPSVRRAVVAHNGVVRARVGDGRITGYSTIALV